MSWIRKALRFVLAATVFIGVGVVARPEQDQNRRRSNSTHAGMECALCHQAVADIGSNMPSRNPAGACRSCHGLATSRGNIVTESFHKDRSRQCNECHSFHETSVITAAGTDFTFSTKAGAGLCAACHNDAGSPGALSEGHLTAAKLYHSNSDLLKDVDASTACMICHSENRTVQIDGLSVGSTPQFSERHMHPLGEIKSSGGMKNGTRVRTSRDPRLHLFNNRIECTTCHQLTAMTKYRLVEFESQQQLCNGCHEFE
jgi:predicted CXXCH cytochrome family protein